jgi:hydrogenase expression/formation protein HypE
VLTEDEIESAKALMSAISVVPEGRIGAKSGVSAMHDATEGGVLGAIHELCDASGKGCIVDKAAIRILPVTSKIASHFNIDPYKLIASGTMVMTVSEQKSKGLEDLLLASGIEFTRVGFITDEPKKILKTVHAGGEVEFEELLAPEADELYKVV